MCSIGLSTLVCHASASAPKGITSASIFTFLRDGPPTVVVGDVAGIVPALPSHLLIDVIKPPLLIAVRVEAHHAAYALAAFLLGKAGYDVAKALGPDRNEQWWFDHVDEQMRREGWD